MMGYRSNVAIAIYGEEDQMAAFIAASRLKQNFAEIFKECEIYPYNSCTYGDVPSIPHLMLLAQFNDVKWYDGYSDVDCWMKFVGLAQEQQTSSTPSSFGLAKKATTTCMSKPAPMWNIT